MILCISTVFSHCFFIAYKDMMNGTEKRVYPIFSFLVAKIFDETMMIG